MSDVYILSAARTPLGKFLGGLSTTPATHLGATAIRAAVQRAGIAPEHVDELIMGQVIQAGAGQAPVRQAALRDGLSDSVCATTINKVFGSGLKAVMMGAAAIRAGDADLIVAGGMENMNLGPYLLPGARAGYRLGNADLVDSTVHDGLWCAICDVHMGMHAERVADKHDVTRDAQDAFALRSHERAVAAMDAGRFRDEIVPVEVAGKKGPTTVVRRLVEKVGGTVNDFDLIEINEAFAAQVLADGNELGFDWDKVNVNGGAIALGHPIGASGARVLTTLLYELRRRGGGKGLATLCLGGGGAVAMAIETV